MYTLGVYCTAGYNISHTIMGVPLQIVLSLPQLQHIFMDLIGLLLSCTNMPEYLLQVHTQHTFQGVELPPEESVVLQLHQGKVLECSVLCQCSPLAFSTKVCHQHYYLFGSFNLNSFWSSQEHSGFLSQRITADVHGFSLCTGLQLG